MNVVEINRISDRVMVVVIIFGKKVVTFQRHHMYFPSIFCNGNIK